MQNITGNTHKQAARIVDRKKFAVTVQEEEESRIDFKYPILSDLFIDLNKSRN